MKSNQSNNQLIEKHPRKNFGFIITIKIIVQNFDHILFFTTVLITGIGLGLVNGFLYKFMLEDIKASDTLAGLSFTFSVISELLMFSTCKYFINYLKGATNCMIVGVLLYFIRFLCMSYTYNAWLVIILQMLHAFEFSLFWAATLDKINAFTPKENLTTMISIAMVIKMGLGSLLANIIGGYVYDKYNGRLLFRFASVAFAFQAIILLINKYNSYRQKK